MSSTTIRGADIVMRTLERGGHRTIFTLSGNHIMSLFDAAIETRIGWCIRGMRGGGGIWRHAWDG